ncbi:MAG: hypothetical protein CVU95_06315 [Firmicutes bacterium HGW-Firmicutes-2]|jgi:multidrug efflux pump subunit AcrB|nr:MAG: hypothetical protein CVU95_06315 [Firmicutes bacterium HGW-Firmicutes-2]
MDKKTSFRVNNRTETIYGYLSLALGGISFAIFLWAVYLSAYNQVGSEVLIGLIELVAIMLCFAGLTLGFIGETREDKLKMTAHFGIALNLIIGIFHVLVIWHAF